MTSDTKTVPDEGGMLVERAMLHSGIENFDELFGVAGQDAGLITSHLSLTLTGPDGSGKSILAMHYASAYALDLYESRTQIQGYDPDKKKVRYPTILYVSTDLSAKQAKNVWETFALDYPVERARALRYAYECIPGGEHEVVDEKPKVDLRVVLPSSISSNGENSLDRIVGADAEDENVIPVYFIDLHSESAGDDWTFLNDLAGMLDDREATSANGFLNFMIVDAVEGLEAYVGPHDAFGEERTRRSRVAQLVRSCNSTSTHLMFVIEEMTDGERLPEQFVTDVVIRMRIEQQAHHAVRTIEIEKCRGAAHTRGRHEYHIRAGSGGTTGKDWNVDHPEVRHPMAALRQKKFLSHFYFVQSLQYWNNRIRSQDAPLPTLVGKPNFGNRLERLNYQLGSEAVDEEAILNSRSENNGSVTFLIGNAGTKKSRLARAFLAHAIVDRRAVSFWADREDEKPVRISDTSCRAIVYLTTSLFDKAMLKKALSKHIATKSHDDGIAREERLKSMDGHIFCRRLDVRHLSSDQFLEIVSSYIRRAQQSVLSETQFNDWVVTRNVGSDSEIGERVLNRARHSSGIHVVIDDWQRMVSMHPEMADNPLLLHSLLTLLKCEGVTSLLVSTQSGRPVIDTSSLPPRDLRKQDERTVFTWNIDFFGQTSTAVSATPYAKESESRFVYELKSRDKNRQVVKSLDEDWCDEALQLDDHFELYSGISTGDPARVPLSVKLYGGRRTAGTVSEMSSVYPGIVDNTLSRVFPADNGDSVVTFEPYSAYDEFFTFADWTDETRLPSTFVIQIDEFWSDDKGALLSLKRFAEEEVAFLIDEGDNKLVWRQEYVDLHNLYKPNIDFQALSEGKNLVPKITANERYLANEQERVRTLKDGTKHSDVPSPLRRQDFFIERSGENGNAGIRLDRFPYYWDFAFILADRNLWERYAALEVDANGTRVGDVWNKLCLGPDRITRSNFGVTPQEVGGDAAGTTNSVEPWLSQVSWEEFFIACGAIAQVSNQVPFGLSLDTQESLSSLVLEVWASSETDDEKAKLFQKLHQPTPNPKNKTRLRTLISECRPSLFLALNSIARACTGIQAKDGFTSDSGGPSDRVACRHWYSTAAEFFKTHSNTSSHTAIRCPGNYVVRGDWSLAIASGSRSRTVGERAIDLLSSRRLNLMRLSEGFGLPVRDIVDDDRMADLQTALPRGSATTGDSMITYGELCSLGATDRRDSQISWLRRSQLSDYDRDCFYFRRWLSRMLEERSDWQLLLSSASELFERILQLKREGSLHDDKYRNDFFAMLADRSTETDAVGKYEKFREKCRLLEASLRS